MRRFDVLRTVSGVNEFSVLICDILRDHKNSNSVADFLKEELTENQLQTVKSVAESGNYPLSLDGLQ